MIAQILYPPRPSAVQGFIVAIISVILALLLKLLLVSIDIENVFLLFFSAVVISAWYGGFQPGLLATVLSALMADYFFITPRGSFSISPTETIRVIIFVGEGLIVSGLSHALRTSRDRYAEENFYRRQSETSLRESEERFRLLVEGVPEYAIYGLDAQGKIVTWNVGGERITGYRAEEVIGQTFGTLFTPEDQSAGKPEQILAAAALEGIYREEGWRVRKDGTRFLAHIVITSLRDDKGSLRGYSKVIRDITARKEREAQIRQLNIELERRVEERTHELREVNDQLESFTYTVSHDLRAPLRGIQGFSEILLEEYAPKIEPTAQAYIKRIVAAAQRMDELIQDLLKYSRLSRADLQLGVLDISWMVDVLLEQMQTQIEAAKGTIKVQYPLGQVVANQGILLQVLTNLILNALTYAHKNSSPQITIRSEERGDWVRVWIEDNGIGIAPQDQERIFRMFERLHGVESYPGTGIGLAIVVKGVERMNGRYGVESTVGEGSRFWIELPKA
jgi:PAS domain S-box-containing protein